MDQWIKVEFFEKFPDESFLPRVISTTITINIAGEGVIKVITNLNIGQKQKFPKRNLLLVHFQLCMLAPGGIPS